VLVIGFGVMFSTLLSGPIALLATLGTMSVAIFSDFIHQLSAGKMIGGGPFEAIIRIVSQDNLTVDLTGVQAVAAHALDKLVQKCLAVVAAAVPDLGRFDYSVFLADGFKIPGDLVAQQSAVMLGFLLPLLIVGYVFLRNREVAR